MKKIANYIALGLFVLVSSNNAYADLEEWGYCYDCDGNVTIYMSTYDLHYGTAWNIDFDVTVNGTVTSYKNQAGTWINTGTNQNLTFAQMPNCGGARISVAKCQSEDNWAAFSLGTLPRGVPIKIKIVQSNALTSTLGCNAVRNYSATFYIPIEPVASGGGNFCINQTVKLNAHTTYFTNTIRDESNGSIKSQPITDTAHTAQWQVANASGGPWTNIPGGPGNILDLGKLQVLGTKYYRINYISSATPQIVPAHWDTIPAIIKKKPDGTDTTIVAADTVWIPQDTVYLSSGGCVLTSNVISVGAFLGPVAKAGTDTTVCSTATVKQMGTSPTSGWTYSWSPSTGLSSTTIANPTAALNIPGMRQYIVTVANPACPVTIEDTAFVTVNPIPTATITGATTVCRNTASPNITFRGANGTPPYTFTYKVNGGTNQTISTSASSSSTVIPISTATATTYTYNLVSVQESSSTTCSQAQTGTVVVTILPAPGATITGTTSICNGAASPNITFTAANGTAPYKFTYNINNGSAQTITASGTTTTVAVPTNTVGAFTYSLTGIQDVNISACGAANGSAVVTINPLPTATITGTTTLCKGSASPIITFTGANATPPYTFTYNINGAATQTISTSAVSSGTTIAVSTATAGSFAYNLVSVKDGSSTACTQTVTATATIVINALPTASITGTANRCLNDPNPNITFTGFGTTPPYVFTYSLSDGTTQTVNTATTSVSSSSVTVSAPTNVGGTYTYSLMSVQDGSSTTCSQNQTGSAVVTVNPMGASLVGTTTVCQNSTAPTITFTGGGGAAPYTFTYNINGGTNKTVISNGTGVATVTVSTAVTGNYVYDLSVIQDNNSLSCVSVASVTVTVSKLPTATVSGTAMRCINGPSPDITFKGATTTGPYIFTYNINGGSNQTVTSLTGDSANVQAPTTGAGTFTYNLVSVQDGTAKTCSQNQTSSAVITVNPLAASIAGTTTLCRNATSPNLTFTGSGGTAPYTFTYNINGGADQTVTAAGTTTTIAAPTNAAGTYTYSITSIKDGTNLNCASLSDATINVNTLPTATISGTTSICENGKNPTITFAGGSSTAPYTFSYTINGGPTQTVTTVSGNTINVSAPTNVTGAFTYSLLNVSDGSTQACSQTQTGSTVVTVTPLTATVTGATVVCKNASSPNIIFSGSGGATPYTFIYTINGITDSVTAATGNSSVTVPATTTVSGNFNYSLVRVKDGSTTACNTAVTGATTVTINPLPTATITAKPVICETANDTVIFTGTGGTSPYTFTYNLGASSSQTVTTTGINTTVGVVKNDVPGTYTYNLLSVMDNYGCSQSQPGTATIVIDPLPTATSAKSTTICENASYTLQNGEATMTNANVLSWAENGAGSITSGGASLKPTYTALAGDAGNTVLLTLTVTSNNTCSGATDIATHTIHVDHLPTATTAGTNTICENASYTLVNVEASNNYGTPKWTENGNGSITNGEATVMPTYTAAPGDAGKSVILTMTVTSTNTCNALPEIATATYTITVDSLPVALSGNSTTICENATYTLQPGDATAKHGSIKWTTEGGAGLITNDSSLVPIYAAATSDAGKAILLVMTVTGTNTCNSQPPARAFFTINVDKLPTATSAKSTIICENESYQLQNGEATMTNANVLSWAENGAGNITSGGASLTPTYTALTGDAGNAITLTLTVTSNNTCVGATATANYTIDVNPLPNASINKDEELCRDSIPKPIVLKGFNGTAPYIFEITINNDPVVVNGHDSALITPKTNKTGSIVYTLINVTDANGCSQAQSGTAKVTVHENPHAIFTINPERTSILEPEITITDASTATHSWMWQFGDGKFSSLANPQTHTYADTGTYKIKLLVSNGQCKDSTSEIVRIILPLSLYLPNTFSPNNDGVNDVFKAEGDGIIKFEMFIYDRWGLLVFHSNDINKGWDGKINGNHESAQIDTYVYVVNLRTLADKHDYTYRGVLNLIR